MSRVTFNEDATLTVVLENGEKITVDLEYSEVRDIYSLMGRYVQQKNTEMKTHYCGAISEKE